MGSIDGINWEMIKQHKNERGWCGSGEYGTKSWNIENCEKYYQYFRIYMTEKNSGGAYNDWDLMCGGFEIYGCVSCNDLFIVKCV